MKCICGPGFLRDRNSDQLTITGAHFGAVQGTYGIAAVGTAYVAVQSWCDNQIVLTVPSTTQSGLVKVTQNGVWSSTVNFTFDGSTVTSINPNHGYTGDQITINGDHFGTLQGNYGYVGFGGTHAPVVSWSNSQIVVTAPTTWSGSVNVAQNGAFSNNVPFTFDAPTVTSISPSAAAPGAQVTITGSHFGAARGNYGNVLLGHAYAASTTWSDTQVVATVPSTTSGQAEVAQNNTWSNGVSFTVLPIPTISSLSPSSGSSGTSVTISGTNLGSSQGTVRFNGVQASPTSWNANSIVVPVPNGATSGNVVVTASGVTAGSLSFTVPAPVLSQVTPTSGLVGTQITLSGSNFGSTQGGSQVLIAGIPFFVTGWSDSLISAPIPGNLTTGQLLPVTVVTSAGTSNAVQFTALAAPTIANLAPATGLVDSTVAIYGSHFGSVQGTSAVYFAGITAPVLLWTDDALSVQVPPGASTGSVYVTVNGINTNNVSFTVVPLGPTIIALSKNTALLGDSITISGSGFGTGGSLSFNGVAASPIDWSDGEISTAVPSGATTGPVIVTVGGQTSNSVVLTIVPAPSITSVSPSAGDIGTVVTISGSNFGSVSPGNAVTFNGLAVQATTWTDTQIVVTAPKGVTTGPVAVRVGTILSNSSNFTVVPAGSSTLDITPSNATLVVGETRTLKLTDDLEHSITGAAWTLSDNTLAQLSTDDPPVLTAISPGIVTVTANSQNLTTSTQFTILAAGSVLAPGTVSWSLPSSTAAF